MSATDRIRGRIGSAIFEKVAGPRGPERRERIRGAGGAGWFAEDRPIRRVHGDSSMFVGGIRALLLQSLHPLAMAAVAEHSGYRGDPWGRLQRTSYFLAATTFGGTEGALEMIGHVRAIHERVTGTDSVTGQPYAASDPALLLWVHAALVDSTLVARALFGTPLAPAEADAYVAEMVIAAELVGVPADLIPASVAELTAYLESVRPDLACTPAAKESMAYLLNPPGLDEDLAEIWQEIADGTVGSLPDWAAELYGYQREPLTVGRRTEITQALGVLDAVYLGEPGVLEARQRIVARIKAAARGNSASGTASQER